MVLEKLRFNGHMNNRVHAQPLKGLTSLLVVAEHGLEPLTLVDTKPLARVRRYHRVVTQRRSSSGPDPGSATKLHRLRQLHPHVRRQPWHVDAPNALLVGPALVGDRSALDIVPKAKPGPVAVLDVDVTVTIRLIAETAYDHHDLGLELLVQRICVVDR